MSTYFSTEHKIKIDFKNEVIIAETKDKSYNFKIHTNNMSITKFINNVFPELLLVSFQNCIDDSDSFTKNFKDLVIPINSPFLNEFLMKYEKSIRYNTKTFNGNPLQEIITCSNLYQTKKDALIFIKEKIIMQKLNRIPISERSQYTFDANKFLINIFETINNQLGVNGIMWDKYNESAIQSLNSLFGCTIYSPNQKFLIDFVNKLHNHAWD